jgi:hypothetical protein
MFRKENQAKNTSIGPDSGAIEFEKYTDIGSKRRGVGARNRNVILKEKNPLAGGKHGAGDGNRTRVKSLEGSGSTIELHPQCEKVL